MQNKSLFISPIDHQSEQKRINPEFIGIGKQLVQTHIRKKNVQLQEKHASNRVSFLQKQQQNAQKKLMKKQQQLEILMNIVARRQADENRRESIRRERQQMLAQQRQKNIKKRNDHQQKMRNAYLCIYDQHHDNYQNLRKTFNKYDQMRKSQKLDEISHKKNMVLSISLDKEQGRNKVDTYHKTRNDFFTSIYKERIREQKNQAERAAAKIQSMAEKQLQLKQKLDNSSSMIGQVQQKLQIAHKMRLSGVNSTLSNKLSRSFYGKSSRASETKSDKKEQDSKVDRLIQKQFLMNQQELSYM